MPHDSRPQQVEAQDVIREIGAKLGSNRFCDLDRRKRHAAVSNRLAGERRGRNLARAFAVEHRLDFAITHHARSEADPTGTFARAQHWPNQRKNAGGLYDHPGRLVR